MPDLKKKWIGADYQGLAIKNIASPVDGTDPATKASAQAQADAAKSAAEATAAADATTKANAAQAAAEATAASLASSAQAAAISAAAADATSKANAAQAAAISAAATDATSKANAAQSAAISAAATDATSKANTAEASAKTYADGKITALVNGADAAYDTLIELQGLLQSNDTAVGTITTALAGKTNKFAANITGSPTAVDGNYEYTVQHDLNKADITVQAFQGNDQVDVFVRKVNDNSLKVITGVALGSTTLRVVVVG